MAWLVYLFVARRCEYAADAGAAALTSDAEAMISGLGRLGRLNDMPLAWSRAAGWLLTHPTTEDRGLAVGRRAGLTPERVQELLANSLPIDDRYGHAERPGEEARVFSTAWKSTANSRLSLAVLAATALVPAAALALTRLLGFEPPHAVAILTGSVLALGAALLVHDGFAARPVSVLETAVRRKLGSDRPDDDALFVALSPGDRPRVYEGFLDWDLGLLSIEPERLRYRGEQITLELPRRAVRSIELGAVMPSWIRSPRVIVRWTAPGGDAALTFRIAGATRVNSIAPASRALAARLLAWRGSGGAIAARSGRTDAARRSDGEEAAGSDVTEGAPPGIGPVTSSTPAEVATPRGLPPLVILIGVLAAGTSLLFGLDAWRGADVFAAALLALLALRWPAMTARERPVGTASQPAAERRAA